MKSRRWLIAFVATVFILLGAVACFNMVVDPFGVFGDKHFNWYSFNMTENPRVAKIAYLDKHHEEFDSYILGASGTSALSPELLGRYTGEKYYNLFVYGADMYDTEQMAEYVLKHYGAKNIVLNLGVASAATYHGTKADVTQYMHANVTGSSKARFYGKYMIANPNYAIAKIRGRGQDTYLQQPFDVFHPEDGTYDKSIRDVEAFGDLEEYLVKYPAFSEFQAQPKGLGYVKECIDSVKAIKEMCDEKGAGLTVLFSPMYGPDSASYSSETLKQLITGLAEVTDFWDFTLSSISGDPRYFYDTTHFRNAVGNMVLARIYGDDSVFVPSDFGVFVTEKKSEEQGERLAGQMRHFAAQAAGEEPEGKNDLFSQVQSADIPVLMYHHVAEGGKDSTTISPKAFEAQIKALSEQGFRGIFLEELVSYVEKGTELPPKPVVITFDDGYMSNYETAFPILKKYNMKATIFAIGISVGKDAYKETGHPIVPHFGKAEMKEMADSGLISIQSHTYDMHQSEGLDGPDYRQGVLRKEGEGEKEYIRTFLGDIGKSREQLEAATGQEVIALAFPNGLHDMFSEVLLNKCGIKVTLVTDEGINTVVRGLPQTLRDLKRVKATDELSPEELMEKIK